MPEENNAANSQQAKTQRNIANNANNIRAAADIASKTSNPYAKAAGMAVKAADKISGGKASEKMGKALNSFMKTQGLKGKMMQAALNKMSESGASNKIASAVNSKNGSLPSGMSPKTGNSPKKADNQQTSSSTTEETSGQGFANFELSIDAIKKILIYSVPVFVVVIFSSIGIIITSSKDIIEMDKICKRGY